MHETKRQKRTRKAREAKDKRYAVQFWYEFPTGPSRPDAVGWRIKNLAPHKLRGERIESKRRKH